MPEQVALNISNDTKIKKSGDQIQWILTFLFNCNNQDNVSSVLALPFNLDS